MIVMSHTTYVAPISVVCCYTLCYYSDVDIIVTCSNIVVTTGANCLGELLKVNNSLKEIDMGWNDIGDNGMSLIAYGLQHNITLTKLNVQACGFSVQGKANNS